MKHILGLDLGTNSIGWAVVGAETTAENRNQVTKILAANSRIIPMDAAQLSDFDRGNTVSATADRTSHRGIRRLHERALLRRERLNRVLDTLGFFPDHFSRKINRYGKFIDDSEPKIAWAKRDDGRHEFVFQSSFEEMLALFAQIHPELAADGKKIPYDWTIYYLRKKALTQAITKQELAWILLNFNQKRGYYQLRGEEEEQKQDELVEYLAQIVIKVVDTGEKKGKDTWYDVHLGNGMIYRRTSSTPLDWVGKVKEFIVTTKLNADGTPKIDKEGNVSRKFRMPKEEDWTLLKKKTELDIENSGFTVGAYIFNALLADPTQKIKGKLVRTVERKFYKEELRQIIRAQKIFHPELNNQDLYEQCIQVLYPSNHNYRTSIKSKGFEYLFVDDIIFYQRPLKSKKSLIDNCPYESHLGNDKKTGKKKEYGVKCIARSNPIFQEFRLWDFISKLRFFEKSTDKEVTDQFLKNEEDWVALFDYLNNRKEISQKTILQYPAFNLNKNAQKLYRWNYVEEKDYPCNETRHILLNGFKKAGIDASRLTKEMEMKLWHILYSVLDKNELTRALRRFTEKNGIDNADSFVEAFKNCPPFKSEYGAYSEKAIRKLLALMRMGNYWKEINIDVSTRSRIDHIINGEVDESITMRVREKASTLSTIDNFKGLPLWLACYVVYGRHSEAKDLAKWQSPKDIDAYLKSFKQHSLNNPIVEQVVMETLRTVRDIWKKYGHIDEIHVELGRELKNPADKRKQITENVLKNEETNLRIKALLMEFMDPSYAIENVRPNSPSQQELLRIYEDGVMSSVSEIPDDIDNILKKFKERDAAKRPSKSDVTRYKLWLEQKYQSPYTGQMIPLGKLFTPAYEIEHVVPQSLYFDDSLNNKVICESAVNKLKDNQLGLTFIQNHGGEIVKINENKDVKILTEDQYRKFVADHYGNNRAKTKRLLLDELPDDFILRQLNDSRYISKLVRTLLSNIVREKDEQEGVSKHVITCVGQITDRLKKDWGINDVWNRIIMPRFKRMNEISGTSAFTCINGNGHEVPCMPLDLQKGFNKKRIDHRHHAMDAIVIACANRSIVNYLNNSSAASTAKETRYDLQHLLCTKTPTDNHRGYKWVLNKPWDTFTTDVQKVLMDAVVSVKQNIRVINKATNKYTVINEDGKKEQKDQTKGERWAIRKPMHKDTVFADVNLRMKKTVSLKVALTSLGCVVNKDLRMKLKAMLELNFKEKQIKQYFADNKDVWRDINLNKIEVWYYAHDTENERYFAVRKKLDDTFDRKKIQQITDTGIQQILLRHLEANDNNPELAFSPDGIDQMNKNIVALNNGVPHKPIYKVRWFEQASKFALGENGNKTKKFVEAAKGTNLYFAIYEQTLLDEKTGIETTKRTFDSIPLNVAISRLKKGLSAAPANAQGIEPKYVLSPGDLVYVPKEHEDLNSLNSSSIDRSRLYRMVSSTGFECYFVKWESANVIVDKVEYQSLNKMGRAVSGEMIKDVCIPVKLDRLGKIMNIG